MPVLFQYKNNAELGSGVGVWYFYNYLCKILIESYRIAGFLQVQQPAVVRMFTPTEAICRLPVTAFRASTHCRCSKGSPLLKAEPVGCGWAGGTVAICGRSRAASAPTSHVGLPFKEKLACFTL